MLLYDLAEWTNSLEENDKNITEIKNAAIQTKCPGCCSSMYFQSEDGRIKNGTFKCSACSYTMTMVELWDFMY